MLGVSDVIACSTLARNHASYAAASSLVANSDSMGVSAGMRISLSICLNESKAPIKHHFLVLNTDSKRPLPQLFASSPT
jgi:hypothetical protein